MTDFHDSEIQSMIDVLVLKERPYTISADDARITTLLGYDLADAEKQLKIWQERHARDCDIIGLNPLTLKIYPTLFRDPDMKIQRDAYVARKRRVSQ